MHVRLTAGVIQRRRREGGALDWVEVRGPEARDVVALAVVLAEEAVRANARELRIQIKKKDSTTD